MTAEKPVKIKEPKVFTQPEPVTDIMPLLETAWDEGTDIKAVLLKNVRLYGTDFGHIGFNSVIFENCRFEECMLDGCSFVDVIFKNCDFFQQQLCPGLF